MEPFNSPKRPEADVRLRRARMLEALAELNELYDLRQPGHAQALLELVRCFAQPSKAAGHTIGQVASAPCGKAHPH